MQTESNIRRTKPLPKKQCLKKQCSKCGVKKRTEDFRRNSATRDGLHSYCAECQETRRLAWRREKLNDAHAKALDYALVLSRLTKSAPDSVTATQINKVVKSIRVRWAKNRRRANREILFAIEFKEARTLEEISEDVGLSKEATLEVLNDLIRKNKIEEKHPIVKPNVQARRKFPLVYYVIKGK